STRFERAIPGSFADLLYDGHTRSRKDDHEQAWTLTQGTSQEERQSRQTAQYVIRPAHPVTGRPEASLRSAPGSALQCAPQCALQCAQCGSSTTLAVEAVRGRAHGRIARPMI